jgi:hypothetical protein
MAAKKNSIKTAISGAASAVSNVEILANAHISEKPERIQFEQLPPDIQIHVVTAKLQGLRPVSIDWPDGKHAIMALEPNAIMPRPEMIIAAYRECEKSDKVFPEGMQAWVP